MRRELHRSVHGVRDKENGRKLTTTETKIRKQNFLEWRTKIIKGLTRQQLTDYIQKKTG